MNVQNISLSLGDVSNKGDDQSLIDILTRWFAIDTFRILWMFWRYKSPKILFSFDKVLNKTSSGLGAYLIGRMISVGTVQTKKNLYRHSLEYFSFERFRNFECLKGNQFNQEQNLYSSDGLFLNRFIKILGILKGLKFTEYICFQ